MGREAVLQQHGRRAPERDVRRTEQGHQVDGREQRRRRVVQARTTGGLQPQVDHEVREELSTARSGEPRDDPGVRVGLLELVEGAQGRVLTQLPELTLGFQVVAETAGVFHELDEERDEGFPDRPGRVASGISARRA
ncbi:hypothetical protein ACIQK5_05965 [Streptomyces virginiae]|uniref:hypothetical protein n=1 Tax=Streptomyces virginiae TaxID=1961 RepID=UPI0038003DB4